MKSLTTWKLKSIRTDKYKTINLINEKEVGTVHTLLRASWLLYPFPSCCPSKSSHLHPCAKDYHWAIRVALKILSLTVGNPSGGDCEVVKKQEINSLTQGKTDIVSTSCFTVPKEKKETKYHQNYIWTHLFSCPMLHLPVRHWVNQLHRSPETIFLQNLTWNIW